MTTKIFVNLPVKNLHKSVEFFTSLGFTFNPRFTDDLDGHIWEIIHMEPGAEK